MSTAPFKPITREQAAEILSVALGTLDAMIASGVLPPPRQLGDCRKLYWHPDVFYGCLQQLLSVDPAPIARSAPDPTELTSEAQRPTRGARSEGPPVLSKPRSNVSAKARGYRDARTR